MASHRRPKQPNRARVTVLTATAAAAVAMTAQSAHADEPSKESVKAKVDKLYEEAEAATESYNGAKEKQTKLEKQVGILQDSVARGQADLNKLRNGLGSMATAQYRTGGVDPSLQLFLSSDPDGYLDKASTLDQVSTKQADALAKIKGKQRTLSQQRTEAKGKLKDLEETRKSLGAKKTKIQGKLGKAQELLNTLSAKERAALAEKEERANRDAEKRASLPEEKPDSDTPDSAPTSGRAGAALAAAKGKIGSPYVWAATGPNSFDCSGLTGWAYKQANVSLPRMSQDQANAGTRISRDALQPGDLVFFYGDLHHVGLYAGNNQVLHAPKPGANVRYESMDNMPYQFGVRV